ncbi:hypothetical protein [Flagellimonas sp.]|uniref:hypothetical protein n=1 Tax=Flagellimonas sp. TaxID=2058762 RepID=UPI003BA9BD17
MRPTLTLIFLVALLYGCGTMHQLQKVRSQVPILGSIGQPQSSLFKKEFQKIGEPHFANPISVSMESFPLSGKTKVRYENYRERMGMTPLFSTMDSAQLTGFRCFQIEINDAVSVVKALNDAQNANLKTYLKENMNLVMLSEISFVADAELSKKLEIAEKLYLTTNQSGALTLKINDERKGYAIQLSYMDIFDYDTASFCWSKNKRGDLQIAQILLDGGTCPGNTEANPEKLNNIPDYLKL